jgi:hypothetical protein
MTEKVASDNHSASGHTASVAGHVAQDTPGAQGIEAAFKMKPRGSEHSVRLFLLTR